MATNDHVRRGGTAQPEYTAVELMKLPREERRRILAKAADEAVFDYENDKQLTDFEAFGNEDLYDETC